MSATAVEYQEDYLEEYTLKSWLLTTDHKRIALLYMAVDHALLLHRRRRRSPWHGSS